MSIKKKDGFTLIEIIVVLVVMGLLLAIAVPAILGYVKKANDAKFQSASRNIFVELQGELAEQTANAGKIKDANAIPKKIYKKIAKEYNVGNTEIADGTIQIGEYYIRDIVTYYDGEYTGHEYEKLDITKTNHNISKLVVWYTDLEYNSKCVVFMSNEQIRMFNLGDEEDYKLITNKNSKWFTPLNNGIGVLK